VLKANYKIYGSVLCVDKSQCNKLLLESDLFNPFVGSPKLMQLMCNDLGFDNWIRKTALNGKEFSNIPHTAGLKSGRMCAVNSGMN